MENEFTAELGYGAGALCIDRVYLELMDVASDIFLLRQSGNGVAGLGKRVAIVGMALSVVAPPKVVQAYVRFREKAMNLSSEGVSGEKDQVDLLYAFGEVLLFMRADFLQKEPEISVETALATFLSSATGK